MRTGFLTAIVTLVLAGFVYATPVTAQTKGTTDQTQPTANTTDANTPAAKDTHSMGNMGKGMGMEMGMGKMNMESMKTMMHECMGMNKDGAMCDQDMMQKCQKDMSKGECNKMMKQAKAQDAATKKK